MSVFDGIGGFISTLLPGITGTTPSPPITGSGSTTDVGSDIASCKSDNPCEAAWQATYTYYADRQYSMAWIQALLGLLYGYLQYKSADRTADQQYDIANRQMSIAEEEYARYKCVYVECEDNYSSEICAMQLPTVDYAIYADRLERDVRKKFSNARNKLIRSRSRYCVADTLGALCDMEKAEALSLVAARDTGYRYAEARRDVLDERRHSRRMEIFTHGRNIKTDQSNSYISGMTQASSALANELAAKSSLYNTVFGVGQGLLNSYYIKTNNPFPYGTGYTGTGGARTSGAGIAATSSPAMMSGHPAM